VAALESLSGKIATDIFPNSAILLLLVLAKTDPK